MPVVEDWINNPLGIVQNFEDQYSSSSSEKVKEYFQKKTETEESRRWIPSLNDTPLHCLRPNSLVRYRCMVQDMFDPEFYLGKYEVIDKETEQSSMKSGKFKDIAECAKHQEILTESSKNVTLDRQTLYCIPIPGESDWVKQGYADHVGKNAVQPSTSTAHLRLKRGLEDNTEGGTERSKEQKSVDDIAMESVEESSKQNTQESDVENSDNKRSKTANTSGTTSQANPDLNFPLPGEKGISCLVKIYDGLDGYGVSDMVEFVGILSVDPSLAQFEGEEESDGMQSSIEGFEESVEERNAHAPPPSLVPRLHAVVSRKLGHNNPHVPLNTDSNFKAALEELQNEVSSLRTQIMSMLEHALFGDKLAAEYFLCHLISSVYGRADVMPLGKFSLNLTHCPTAGNYGELLYTLISAMVTKSHLLPMTIENMNSLRLCPEKDYTANRLKTGLLQLSSDTALIVDETKLQPGQLQAQGVGNLTALGNVICWQKVEYDFRFHKQDFMSNIAVLTLSEGKSILPSDCMVPLEATTKPSNLREHFTALDPVLTPEFLHKVRTFITLARQIPYNVSQQMQMVIQDDFVEIRKDDPKNMTVDDFHMLLNFVRLLSLSHLENMPTEEVWKKAKALESQRKRRIQSTRPS